MIGKRITPTDLPQTVAALHSVVGLAAVLTSIGSVMAGISDISTLHMVTGYLGVLIGMLCLPLTPPSFITTNMHRWHHIYWLHCRIYETGWQDVFEAQDATRTAHY